MHGDNRTGGRRYLRLSGIIMLRELLLYISRHSTR